MKCKENSCYSEVTNRSRSGLCKKHYGYLWKSLNKDKTAIHSKNTYNRNKDYYIKSTSEKRSLSRKLDPEVRLRDSLRRRLNNALKNNQKMGSAVSNLGCSIQEFRVYLETKFQSGMTWNNYGKFGWHIDHIKPLSKFDLSNKEQLKEACYYTNLQPLWWQDNLKKGNSE
jgi:hypothetical protein